MKFGKVYERLKQNPIFAKYLPEAQFLPYKHLKTLVKNMIKIEDREMRENENQRILNELKVFVEFTCDFVDEQLNKFSKVDDGYIKKIKEFKALKEYCNINKEAIRKCAKKYDKLALPKKEAYLQKQMLELMNAKEIGKQEQIDILLQKAKDEEQELLENENFGLLLQDVHQLHNNQDQMLTMLDTKEQTTHYTELILGFCALVFIPVCMTPYLDTGLSIIANIFMLTMPLAFFLGVAIGGTYGNKQLSRKQAFYLGALFECQVFGAITLGGFASQNKKIPEVDVFSLDPHNFRAYTEDLNFVTLGIQALMTSLSFNLIANSIYSIPVSVSKNVVIASTIIGVYRVQTTGLLTNKYTGFVADQLSPPVIAFLLTLVVYGFIIIAIKKAQNPYQMSIAYLPVFGFLKVSVIFYLMLFYGLKLEPQLLVFAISIVAGSCAGTYFYVYGQSQLAKSPIECVEVTKKQDLQDMAIKTFQPLLLLSALIAAFMNGSEDVGKFIKPLVQALNLEKPSNNYQTNYIYWTCVIIVTSLCSGILGLFSRSIKTKLTTMNPMQSFVVQVGASFAIIIATFQDLPLTPSYCTVGSVIGMVVCDQLTEYQKFKKTKHLIKLVKKLAFILPFFALAQLYNFYYDQISKNYSSINDDDGVKTDL